MSELSGCIILISFQKYIQYYLTIANKKAIATISCFVVINCEISHVHIES